MLNCWHGQRVLLVITAYLYNNQKRKKKSPLASGKCSLAKCMPSCWAAHKHCSCQEREQLWLEILGTLPKCCGCWVATSTGHYRKAAAAAGTALLPRQREQLCALAVLYPCKAVRILLHLQLCRLPSGSEQGRRCAGLWAAVPAPFLIAPSSNLPTAHSAFLSPFSTRLNRSYSSSL